MSCLEASSVLEPTFDCATVESKPESSLNDTLIDNTTADPPRFTSDVIEHQKIPFLNNWTLDETKIPKYPLFNKVFTEVVDKKLCELILDSNDRRLNIESKNLFRSTVYKNISLNQLKVRYNNRKGLGRVYPDRDVGLTPQSRCIKNSLYSYHNCKDIDMKKSFPNIILSLAKNNGIKLPEYEYYVNNFDSIVNGVSEYYSKPGEPRLQKDQVKWLFNIILFGGGFSTWKEGLEKPTKKDIEKGYKPVFIEDKPLPYFVEKFKLETKRIFNIINTHNPALKDKLWNSKKSTYENTSSLISFYIGTIENFILYNAIEYCVKKKIIKMPYLSLAYDGFTIPQFQSNKKDDEIIFDLNEYIRDVTGLNTITFDFKDFDEDTILSDLIDKRLKMEDDIENEGVLEGDDATAAENVLEKFPDWKYYKGDLYVFDVDTGIWTTDHAVKNKIVTKCADVLHIMKQDQNGNLQQTGKNYARCHHKRLNIFTFIEERVIDGNWMDRVETSSLGKLLFANGVLDMRTGKFYDKFDPEIYFEYGFNYNFETYSEEDVEYMDSIRRRIFCASPGEESGNYLLLQIARALAGDVMKRVIFGLGLTDTGKSSLSLAIKYSLGGYAGEYNAEKLTETDSNEDEAQKMRWALLLRFKRIIYSNEMRTTKNISHNMIKKISSGGDALTARLHYKDEISFRPHFVPFVYANDLPKFPNDTALNNRLRVVNFKKRFVDSPSNENEIQKDLNLESEIKSVRFQRCFVGLLIKTYMDFYDNGCIENEPIEVLNAKDDWIGNISDDTILDDFLLEYEITDDVDDFVPSSEINDWLTHNKYTISFNKFIMLLKTHCKVRDFDNFESTSKKCNGRSLRGWCGIKNI